MRARDVRGGGTAEQLDGKGDLGPEELQQPGHAGVSIHRQSPDDWPADEDCARPQGERLDDVRAPANASVEEDLRAAADRVNHLRKRL